MWWNVYENNVLCVWKRIDSVSKMMDFAFKRMNLLEKAAPRSVCRCAPPVQGDWRWEIHGLLPQVLGLFVGAPGWHWIWWVVRRAGPEESTGRTSWLWRGGCEGLVFRLPLDGRDLWVHADPLNQHIGNMSIWLSGLLCIILLKSIQWTRMFCLITNLAL